MIFRIAYHLGYTVEELLTKCTTRELAEWVEYFELHPPEQPRWQQMALLCTVFVNSIRVMASGKVPKEAKLADFLPAKKKRRQTVKQQIAILKGVAPSKD